MTFLSLYFALFLSLSLIVYYLVTPRFRPLLIAVISVSFYMWWNIGYAILLVGITALIFWAVKLIKHQPLEQKKFYFSTLLVIVLVLVLGFFKYFDFLSLNFFELIHLGQANTANKPFLLKLLIPIGISYYTFKAISYVMDCYWEKIEPETDYFFLLAHFSFFPQIISGPVQRASDFLPQIRNIKQGLKFDPYLFESGLKLLLWGLFKKLVVADNLAKYVNSVYIAPENFFGFYAILACWFFTFQLYADFSGITDIAIGMGRLFGIQTPQNFNRPFVASNIQDFWSRWHITLTTWLGDYVFVPLRMQFRNWGTFGIIISIMSYMLAIGIWHGATWNFVVFGFVHALLMISSYFSLDIRNKAYTYMKIPTWFRNLIGMFFTFNTLAISLVLFKASSLQVAHTIIRNIFLNSAVTLNNIQIPFHLKTGIVLIVLFLIIENFTSIAHDQFDKYQKSKLNNEKLSKLSLFRRFALFGFLGALILLAGVLDGGGFIYEQF